MFCDESGTWRPDSLTWCGRLYSHVMHTTRLCAVYNASKLHALEKCGTPWNWMKTAIWFFFLYFFQYNKKINNKTFHVEYFDLLICDVRYGIFRYGREISAFIFPSNYPHTSNVPSYISSWNLNFLDHQASVRCYWTVELQWSESTTSFREY